MKIKKVVIGIKSVEEMLGEAKDVMKRLETSDKVERRKPGVYFENLETMRKAITEEKLRILKVIKAREPSSIYELAQLVNRNLKNVSDDVHYLNQLGLIDLKKTKETRQRIIPRVNYDKILLEIPV